jgi:alpha-mannosidase
MANQTASQVQLKALRHQLAIHDDASFVLFLEQSSHLDWDWTSTFLDYYNGGSGHNPVYQTYSDAITELKANQTNSPPYYYTFCEMSYLRQYLQDPNYSNQTSVLQGLLDVISISGGGITSAENLVCHGEAFIRNYLIGRQWIANTLNVVPADLSVTQLWIPDDFGHDSQLPIVAQAMGYQGVAFERIPLDPFAPWGENAVLTANAPPQVLTNNKELDFMWVASDGSQVQAHWLAHGYCEGNPGNTIGSYQGSNLPWDSDTQAALTQFVTENQAVTDTTNIPYMFVPIDCDFTSPYLNLMEIVANWNACNGFGTSTNCPSPPPATVAGVQLVVAPFATFMELVKLHTTDGSGNSTLPRIQFSSAPGTTILPPNPSYSGCYVSHPDLKKHHYSATRDLLTAESFETIVEYLAAKDATTWLQIAGQFRTQLYNNWNALMPSSHHDYVVGTAPDNVYSEEQAPDLIAAHSSAVQTRKQILAAVTSAISASPQSGEQPVAVFNPIGTARAGLVEMESPGSTKWTSVRIGSQLNPIQIAADGKVLFLSDAPSFGYSTFYLSTQAPNNPSPPKVKSKYDSNKNTYKLSNEYLTADIGVDGIISLKDHQGNAVLNGTGNQILFYVDGGGIYRFGNEIPGNGQASPAVPEVPFHVLTPAPSYSATLELIEDGEPGNLRVSVGVKGTFVVDGDSYEFQVVYSLVAGENLLRISTKGKAPSGYSVMVSFPFTSKATSLTHGTAYHWDTGYPRTYWTNSASYNPSVDPTQVEYMTFEATHEFVIPQADETMLGAVYHESTPAWAIDTNGNLLGCILRNTPGNYNGASGTDFAEHLANYAIRPPGTTLQSPLAGAGSGGPLGEALQFNNPLIGIPLPASQTGSATLLDQMSVASTADPTAIVTAVKAGTMNENELILRVYKPTTSALSVEIMIDQSIAGLYQQNGVLQVSGTTALELPLEQPLTIAPQASSFTFTAPFALTTLALERS